MDLFTVNGCANLVLDMIFLPQASDFPSVGLLYIKGNTYTVSEKSVILLSDPTKYF